MDGSVENGIGSPRSGLRVAIVGGGASGVIAAAHLLREMPGAVEIDLIERGGAFGQGLAYSTRDPRHLLNVPAANMSALASEPGHFIRWLRARAEDLDLAPGRVEACFAPRRAFGAYLGGLLDGAPAGAVRRIADECIGAASTHDGLRLHLRSGESLNADLVILATGHDLQGAGVIEAAAIGAHDASAIAAIGAGEAVVIVGAGLTMVDVAVTLHARGHRGPITAISRRGLLPERHRPRPPPQAHATPPSGLAISELMRWLRQFARSSEARGGDWRSAVDALRPHTQALWRGMTPDQRRRFLRHARPWWDVRRHRMAPEIAATIEAMRANGQLRLLAGRILGARSCEAGVEIVIRRRGEAASESLRADHVVACTGAQNGPSRTRDRLTRSLIANGLARPDELDIGLDVSADGAVIDAAGHPSDRLFAVGPAARAAYWEIIAVPDIRAQCARLAGRLAMRGHGDPSAELDVKAA